MVLTNDLHKALCDLENAKNAHLQADDALSIRYNKAHHEEIMQRWHETISTALVQLDDSAATAACLNIIKSAAKAKAEYLTKQTV